MNGHTTYLRHVGQLKEGGAIGVSLFFLVQSYKCQSGGLNEVVRKQCTALMVFRTKDTAELDDIASSVAGEIDRPTFDQVYGAAVGDGGAGTWRYSCVGGCDFDLCVACIAQVRRGCARSQEAGRGGGCPW